MKRWGAIVVAALGVILVGYALFSSETDEEKIAGILEQLEDAIRISEASDNPVMRTAHVNGEFKEIFEKNVTYRIPELSSGRQGRGQLARLAVQSGSYMSAFDVDFSSVDIELTGGGTGATVKTLAQVTATRGSNRVERDQRKVRFAFSNGDDGWRIASLVVYPKAEPAEEEEEADEE